MTNLKHSLCYKVRIRRVQFKTVRKLCNPNKTQISCSSILLKEVQSNNKNQLNIKSQFFIAQLRVNIRENPIPSCNISQKILFLPSLIPFSPKAPDEAAFNSGHKQTHQINPLSSRQFSDSFSLNLPAPASYLVDLLNFCSSSLSFNAEQARYILFSIRGRGIEEEEGEQPRMFVC